ncbi:hypothetical protein [Rugosimonospora africana]|uniref:Uncharacterized protein n=1 Tax=Rugosimonospora africana TaxID=556532 RepID=A0A8J3R7K7_9ACTN|nr:hypothetical protein [Rugosimonospora africana]GIH21486.1 hypothetical protein Raf01_96580 [Rugosimonospora africana]
MRLYLLFVLAFLNAAAAVAARSPLYALAAALFLAAAAHSIHSSRR